MNDKEIALHIISNMYQYVPYDDIIWGITCCTELSPQRIGFSENYTSAEGILYISKGMVVISIKIQLSCYIFTHYY